MAQNAIQPFPPLPFDISREIFERAVVCNAADRYSLAFVSRLIQKWTDPYVFRTVTVSSHRRTERFRVLLEIRRSRKSGRFIRALSFVQTLAIKISDFNMSWETIVSNFPRLVELFWEGTYDSDFVEGNQDLSTYEPRSIPTLRYLSGGYGHTTLCGRWGCVQMLSHLDLTRMASCAWSTLESRSLQLLSSLTHLFVCLDELPTMVAREQELSVLPPFFPPSLLVCLISGQDFDLLSREEGNALSILSYKFDDRFLVCMGRNSPVHNQWILKMEWENAYVEWSEHHDEHDTFWVRGLNMVTERRTVISISD
ncbi:hypothetical protein DL96DRAFT_1638383 [Flagelloscypha sp. PMI_526]|nr:hypothetical protein DL96DRAFT_1638383 [Flagelloscypha sp. PMI_526]